MSKTFDRDKYFPLNSSPLKPALAISGKILVVIDSELVQQLQLDDGHTWFYEELNESGIFLRVHRIKDE